MKINELHWVLLPPNENGGEVIEFFVPPSTTVAYSDVDPVTRKIIVHKNRPQKTPDYNWAHLAQLMGRNPKSPRIDLTEEEFEQLLEWVKPI